MKYNLVIGWLYPDLMSTYGDRGNIICLTKRCQWRGITVEVKEIGLETDSQELLDCDLLFMGGAQDRQQKLAGEDLRKNKGPVMKEMMEAGIPALFVCAAYQFMGHYYRPAEGKDIPGLGIFDLCTVHPGSDKPRCIGNIAIRLNSSLCHPEPFGHSEQSEESQGKLREGSHLRFFGLRSQNDMEKLLLVGFENHGGRTYLGKGMKPLGEVVVGYGNNGDQPSEALAKDGDKTEGAVYKNAFGTYLHGPILPKNPHFADFLLKLVLEKKYGAIKLHPLDDSLEWVAHKTIARRLGVNI